MGSYLSIVNNTPDPWKCHLGPDTFALKIFGIIVAIVGAAVSIIATAGAAAPVVAKLSAAGVVSVLGISTSSLAAAASAAASAATVAKVVGTVSSFAWTVTKGVSEHLVSKNYHAIAPGHKHRWGKMTLSLWQQGTCVRTVVVDECTVRTDTLLMRPIFSGLTANSNRNHDIQWWLNKNGVESKTIKAKRPAPDQQQNRVLELDEHIKIYREGETNVDDLDVHEGDVVYILPPSA